MSQGQHCPDQSPDYAISPLFSLESRENLAGEFQPVFVAGMPLVCFHSQTYHLFLHLSATYTDSGFADAIDQTNISRTETFMQCNAFEGTDD